MVINNRIRDVVHTSTTRMLKLFIIFSIFLCLNSNVSAVTGNNYNTSLNNRYLGYETAKNIFEDDPYSTTRKVTESEIITITNIFNEWFETQEEDITLRNVCFFFSGTTLKRLYWFVSNGTYSETLQYAYLNGISTTGDSPYIKSFIDWTYNSNGVINGANVGNIPTFYASTAGLTDRTNNSEQISLIGTLEGSDLKTYDTKYIQAPLSTFVIYGRSNDAGYGTYFLKNTFRLEKNPAAEPTPTPTPTPEVTQTPTSGDYGPAIDNINNNLNNIESTIKSGDEEIKNEISDIKNFLSGEANFENKEISSEEILDSINIETIRDPYENFWFELTEILNDAFTEEVRSLNLKVRNKEFQINIDQIGWNPNATMKTFLTLASTTAVCIAIIKWITVITEKIQSGSMDEVLEANEEGICSLF